MVSKSANRNEGRLPEYVWLKEGLKSCEGVERFQILRGGEGWRKPKKSSRGGGGKREGILTEHKSTEKSRKRVPRIKENK